MTKEAYVQATLPYNARSILVALNALDNDGYSGNARLALEQAFDEHLFRLHFALVDPDIPAETIEYAQAVWPDLVEYARKKNYAKIWEDREMEMLPGDILLPAKLNCGRLYQEIIQEAPIG